MDGLTLFLIGVLVIVVAMGSFVLYSDYRGKHSSKP